VRRFGTEIWERVFLPVAHGLTITSNKPSCLREFCSLQCATLTQNCFYSSITLKRRAVLPIAINSNCHQFGLVRKASQCAWAVEVWKRDINQTCCVRYPPAPCPWFFTSPSSGYKMRRKLEVLAGLIPGITY
jgi:hypothetical protein